MQIRLALRDVRLTEGQPVSVQDLAEEARRLPMTPEIAGRIAALTALALIILLGLWCGWSLRSRR